MAKENKLKKGSGLRRKYHGKMVIEVSRRKKKRTERYRPRAHESGGGKASISWETGQKKPVDTKHVSGENKVSLPLGIIRGDSAALLRRNRKKNA